MPPLQETELRTLKASAEDIAAKFDEAVAALAGKRLDVQSEVCARVHAAQVLPAAAMTTAAAAAANTVLAGTVRRNTSHLVCYSSLQAGSLCYNKPGM
jgi:hypothetical protein